jgi:acetolactate synthase-1/2/3 large subunit
VKADVLLILGSGLNQRDTMFWSPELPKATIQVDIDATTFGRNYPVAASVMADAREFLGWMLNDPVTSKALAASRPARDSWIATLMPVGTFYDVANTKSAAVPIHPARVVYDLNHVAPRNCMLLVDSGAHRAFAAQYWQCFGPSLARRYFTASTMAPMGWAVAAAVGVKLAQPNRPCAVLTGDGCMLMHGIEIQTAVRYKLPIVYVVINNSAYGNVYLRAKQMGSSAAALTELPTHDWVRFANALGASGIMVDKPGDLAAAFKAAFNSNGPFVIDVRCDRDAGTPVGPWQRAKPVSFD